MTDGVVTDGVVTSASGATTPRGALAPLWALLSGQLGDRDEAEDENERSGGVVVVGFGLDGDVKRCCEWHPRLPRRWRRVIDLQRLARPARLLASGRTCAEIGLGALALKVLNVALDKGPQTSDWSVRPLSAAQCAYAALDAHILLPLMDAMLARLALPSCADAGDAGAGTAPSSLVDTMHSHVRALEVNVDGARHSASACAMVLERGTERVRRALLSAGLDRAAESISVRDGVTDAANQENTAASEALVVKTLALVTNRGDLVLCVLPLQRRLRVERCAHAIGVRRSDLSMVRTDDLIDVVGFPRGAIGPFGARRAATVLIDEALLSGDSSSECAHGIGGAKRVLLCGAGEIGAQFSVTVSELLAQRNTRAADFAAGVAVEA